jgi:predicted transcriptional regulator
LRGHAASYEVLFPKILERIKTARYSLIILDPIYKCYGGTDENSAGQVAQLLNAIEQLAVQTGAAVAFGAHFAKGNAAGKESIDRISGSGVFARDPDALLTFTRHEAADAFTVEATLRNFKQIDPFVVRWDYPVMRRDGNLDPKRLRGANVGRKRQHDVLDLLAAIKKTTCDDPVSVSEWASGAKVEHTTLYRYLPAMVTNGCVAVVGEGKTARRHITAEGLNALRNNGDAEEINSNVRN